MNLKLFMLIFLLKDQHSTCYGLSIVSDRAFPDAVARV